MTSADFRAWLERHKFTYDAAAAQLGISRRLVAYYASKRHVPRYIALASRYLDSELALRSSNLKRAAAAAAVDDVTVAIKGILETLVIGNLVERQTPFDRVAGALGKSGSLAEGLSEISTRAEGFWKMLSEGSWDSPRSLTKRLRRRAATPLAAASRAMARRPSRPQRNSYVN